MYTNTRRAATNRLQTAHVTNASALTGAEQRKALLISLTPQQQKQLEQFKLSDGRTETDVYAAYACSLDYKSARVALETDTPPRLIVQDLFGLDKVGKSNFFLPAHVIDDVNWRSTFVRFERWCFSSNRYPVLDETEKIAYSSVNADAKEISELDMLEMYFAALFATLGEYFAKDDIKYAVNAWKLSHTLNYYLKQLAPKEQPSVTQLLTDTEKLKKLILNRDKSVNDAVEYRQFINTLKPACYYWMLYNLMLECPEVVHKSHLSNLDTFILGLMTQPILGNIGCTLSGIEDSLLRMILERSMKWIAKQNLAEFVEKDAAVEFLHRHAGRSVESALRYWSFMVDTIRNLFLVRSFTQNEFVARLQVIRNHKMQLRGITPLCLSICPDAEKYLSDDVLAEFILACSQADKKFTVLLTSILSSSTGTPMLNDILKKNIQRVQKLQDEIYQPAVEPANVENTPVTAWTDFLAEVNYTKSNAKAVHSKGYMNYKRWIIKLAYRGDDFSLRCLQQLLNEGYQVDPPLLGPRKARNIALRAAKENSAVLKYFSVGIRQSEVQHIRSVIPKDGVGTMLKDINRDISKITNDVKDTEKQPDDFDASPIEFVKFELARDIVHQVHSKMQSELDAIICECYICYEEVASHKMVVLHGDTRHSVCETCRIPLKSCPFCRANL